MTAGPSARGSLAGMAIRAGVVCTLGVGPRRGGRSENEDNYLVCHAGSARWLDGRMELEEATRGEGTLLAVCDGMGGHRSGRVASTAAVRVLAKLYASTRPADPAANLLRYVREAHAQLHRRASENGPVRMGTTLTVCWILGDQAAWAHVGDSRLYRLREGGLDQLTRDHTRGEFARRDGRPVAEPDTLCQGFIFGSRGLGDDAGLRLEPGLDNGMVQLQPGDRLLLCSDGLCGWVEDALLAEILARHDDPSEAARALSDAAVEAGSTDNITALVAMVDAA